MRVAVPLCSIVLATAGCFSDPEAGDTSTTSTPGSTGPSTTSEGTTTETPGTTSATDTSGGGDETSSGPDPDSTGSGPGPTTGDASTGGACTTVRFGENDADDFNGVTQDTTLFEMLDSQTLGNDPELKVDGNAGDRQIALVRFDLSGLPAGVTIDGAGLGLSTNASMGAASNIGDQFNVFVVTQPWAESANWTERMPGQEWSVPGCAMPPCLGMMPLGFTEFPAKNETRTINLPPPAVQQWADDASNNHGVAILTNEVNGVDLHSSESDTSTTMRPWLEITYCER